MQWIAYCYSDNFEEKEFNESFTRDALLIGETINVTAASRAINCLLEIINKGETLTAQTIDYVINMVEDGEDDKISRIKHNTGKQCKSSKFIYYR